MGCQSSRAPLPVDLLDQPDRSRRRAACRRGSACGWARRSARTRAARGTRDAFRGNDRGRASVPGCPWCSRCDRCRCRAARRRDRARCRQCRIERLDHLGRAPWPSCPSESMLMGNGRTRVDLPPRTISPCSVIELGLQRRGRPCRGNSGSGSAGGSRADRCRAGRRAVLPSRGRCGRSRGWARECARTGRRSDWIAASLSMRGNRPK